MAQKTGIIGYFLRRFAVRFTLVFAVVALHRYLILETHFSRMFSQLFYDPGRQDVRLAKWWEAYQDPVLAGVGADLIFALIGAGILMMLGWRLVVLAVLILGAFHAANIEHVRYNYSHIDLGTLHFALDRSFIEGSGLTADFFLQIAAFTGLTLALGWALRWVWMRRLSLVLVLPAFGAAVLLMKAPDPLFSPWMQTHPLGLQLGSRSVSVWQGDFDVTAFHPQPVAQEDNSELNVLVVYLEGLSQISLERGDTPYLAELAQENVQFSRYFSHQLQTSNGLYSSMTGAIPNILGSRTPWDLLHDDHPLALTSMPSIFKKRGYHTAFLQSARLSFMDKDEHMHSLGFDTVLGRDEFTDFHLSNGWGIDDRSLIENALTYVDALEEGQSWMVSLLTSGTHAPYNVPEDFEPNLPTRLRALRYADQSVRVLIDGLKARGLLQNTVIVISSDELRERGGLGSLENEIVLNWLPLIVVHPDGPKEKVEWPMRMTGFRDLVLDVSGAWSGVNLSSHRKDSAPVVFGNYLNSRLFWYQQNDSRLFACFTRDFLCARFDGVTDLAAVGDRVPDAVVRVPAIAQLVRAHDTWN